MVTRARKTVVSLLLRKLLPFLPTEAEMRGMLFLWMIQQSKTYSVLLKRIKVVFPCVFCTLKKIFLWTFNMHKVLDDIIILKIIFSPGPRSCTPWVLSARDKKQESILFSLFYHLILCNYLILFNHFIIYFCFTFFIPEVKYSSSIILQKTLYISVHFTQLVNLLNLTYSDQ